MLFEVFDQGIRCMEVGIHGRILRYEFARERKHCETSRDAELEIVGLFWRYDVVRPDTSAAVNHASEIRMLDLVLFLLRTISVVVVIELRDVRIVALNQSAARRVPL